MTSILLDGLIANIATGGAAAGEPVPRAVLDQVLLAGNPLGAAALADRLRRATGTDTVTYPVTLRVRLAGLPPEDEGPLLLAHDLDALDGIEATELELVGTVPADTSLAQLVDWVASAHVVRPDLPIRAFTTDAVLAAADRDGCALDVAVSRLIDTGLTTFDWTPGSDADPRTLDVHRVAHEEGLSTHVALPYSKGGLVPFLDRLELVAALADETGRIASVVPLPDRTEGASPLEGTAGTEDTFACALARLGVGHAVSTLTVDAHVLGHKLGAILLAAGANDFVGAQAAREWKTPTNDGPRQLNEARVANCVAEARRVAERR